MNQRKKTGGSPEEQKKINITEESIVKVNHIIKNMEGNSFHNHYHILYDICNSIGKENINYLEIGTYCGGSASLVSTNQNVLNVYSVDIGHPIPKDVPIRNVTKFKHSKCNYDYILGNSMSEITIELVKSKVKEVDVLFIDGDHSYDAVVKDFNNYKDLVSKNGYIIFDDYMDNKYSPQVFTAVNDIINGLNSDEFGIVGSLVYELIKKTNRPDKISSNEFILKKLN